MSALLGLLTSPGVRRNPRVAVPPPRSARLWDNQDGAIMVMGVFIAIVLVGLLYYVAGVGQAVFRRERMQDAADAVALATAIGHARGMNLIVFINLVMAALVAIVLALKVIELMLTALTLILAAISWLIPPAAAAIPIVNEFREVMHNVHETARDIVDDVLLGLNLAERAIRVITPASSVIMAMTKVGEKYSTVAEVTVAVPPRLTLPVENDVYNTLCDRGGDMLVGIISQATSGIPFVGKVIGLAVDGLIDGVKYAFCYRDGTPPPSTDINITRTLPIEKVPGLDCEADKTNMKVPSDNCTQWEEELRQRHPEADGNCPDTNDERARLCKNASALARVQCDPLAPGAKENYSWSEQDVLEHVYFDPKDGQWHTDSYAYADDPAPQPQMHNTVTYEDADRAFLEAQQQAQAGTADFDQIEANQKTESGRPCDNRGVQYRENVQPEELWSAWNIQPYQDEFEGVVKPVCDRRAAALKTLPYGGQPPENFTPGRMPQGIDPAGYTLRYKAVKHVYSCTEKAKIPLNFPAEWTSAQTGDGDDKAPQKMEEGVLLGDDNFQIRGLAINFEDRRPEQIKHGMSFATVNRNVDPEDWVGAARAASKIAVAQAEYYFNHNGRDNADRKEWMWHMDWKARLVRFRLPSDDDQQDSGDQSDADLASLGSSRSGEVKLDMSSVQLPGDAPSLGTIEQLVVH